MWFANTNIQFILEPYVDATFQCINICPFEHVFVLKSQVPFDELEPNSIDIMHSSIIDKYINRTNQYESLSLAKFSFFIISLKKTKHRKPKIIRFINYNKYKNIENWLRVQLLSYSSFQNSENSQFGINVTWHDAYCQQHDDISKIKYIFNYQMPYPNTKNMDDSIYSKLKPLCSINISINNIYNEVNDPRPTILITNIINIKHYDL